MTFTFVPAIQAMPRSSSSICVAKVAVTRYLLVSVYASDIAAGLPHQIPTARTGGRSDIHGVAWPRKMVPRPARCEPEPRRKRLHLLRAAGRIAPTIAVVIYSGNLHGDKGFRALERPCPLDSGHCRPEA